MGHIHLETLIHAPAERCFDLMRDVDAHTRSTDTGERAVAGRTSGLLEDGDEITWEATHFGVRQRMTVRVTRCDRPDVFEDVQVRGPFAWLHHRHEFSRRGEDTLMTDDFSYGVPLGPLGAVVDRIAIGPHLRRFLMERARALKRMAERDLLTIAS